MLLNIENKPFLFLLCYYMLLFVTIKRNKKRNKFLWDHIIFKYVRSFIFTIFCDVGVDVHCDWIATVS